MLIDVDINDKMFDAYSPNVNIVNDQIDVLRRVDAMENRNRPRAAAVFVPFNQFHQQLIRTATLFVSVFSMLSDRGSKL